MGLTINENLSWKSHVDKISNKISKYSGVLCRLKNFLPTNILRMIYCSIIQSNLNYSLLAWGFECDRLIKLQKKIIRIICSSKYNAHTEPLFKTLKLLKLTDMMKLNTLKFYYKLKDGKVPAYFENYQVLTQQDIHDRNTRFNYIINRNITRTALQQKCLRNNLPLILSNTPSNILDKVSTHSYRGYTNYIKDRFIENYSMNCNIPNCYICSI